MIHANDNEIMPIVREKVAAMFEIAVNIKKIPLEEFINLFLNSKICIAMENGSSVYALGKSTIELLEIIFNEEIEDYDIPDYPTPEYWCGYVLAYTQWYYNLRYSTILKYVSIKEILMQYFPYHEMDISNIVEYIYKKIPFESELKRRREALGLTQQQLSILSYVPIRSIRAYEQGTIELSSAQGDTLFAIARVLRCSIEDLICKRR